MKQFDGKVAIVTGGAQGIGGASARKLALNGANVIIADIDEEASKKNVEKIQSSGGNATFLKTDVSKSPDIKNMIAFTYEKFNRIDILVQNAFPVITGASRVYGDAVSVKEEDWDYGISVLAKAIYLGTKHVVPIMKKNDGGSIVNMASVHSILQEPGMLVYEAGKAAVVGMTRQMAIEYGPYGIRVNAIAPGHIVSEGLKEVWDKNPSGLKFFENQYPVRRTGIPDDIANGVNFLCSQEASFITGHTLAIDGGLTIQLQEQFGLRQGRYLLDNPDTNMFGPSAEEK